MTNFIILRVEMYVFSFHFLVRSMKLALRHVYLRKSVHLQNIQVYMNSYRNLWYCCKQHFHCSLVFLKHTHIDI